MKPERPWTPLGHGCSPPGAELQLLGAAEVRGGSWIIHNQPGQKAPTSHSSISCPTACQRSWEEDFSIPLPAWVKTGELQSPCSSARAQPRQNPSRISESASAGGFSLPSAESCPGQTHGPGPAFWQNPSGGITPGCSEISRSERALLEPRQNRRRRVLPTMGGGRWKMWVGLLVGSRAEAQEAGFVGFGSPGFALPAHGRQLASQAGEIHPEARARLGTPACCWLAGLRAPNKCPDGDVSSAKSFVSC